MYIAFEGINGSGTTDMARIITAYLNGKNIPAVCIAEPSDGPVGKLLKRHMKKPIFHSRDAVTQLFAADRVEQGLLIEEYQSESRAVIADRCLLSSYVYQGRSVKEEWIEAHNIRAPLPDRIIYLYTDAEIAARKAANREQLESEDESRLLHLYRELVDGYEKYAEKGHICGVPIEKVDNTSLELGLPLIISVVDSIFNMA
jgi:dTMP kinase